MTWAVRLCLFDTKQATSLSATPPSSLSRRNVIRLTASTAALTLIPTFVCKAHDGTQPKLPGLGWQRPGEPEYKVLQEGQKVIHFVRHGEGYHNIGVDVEDAPLTSRGWADATALKAHIEALPDPLPLQVVFVSPLRRTLETACGAFGGEEGGTARPLLMLSQPHVPHAITQHDSIAQREDSVPFVAVEDCRERMSTFQCDRRSPVRVQKTHFPGVDFSFIRDDEDVLWGQRHAQVANEEGTDSRYRIAAEKKAAVTQRGVKFVKWVLDRPERHIAVVSHRELLYNTLGALSSSAPKDVAKQMTRPFNNCEMRSVVFDQQGMPVKLLEETLYPGGSARLWLFPVNVVKQQGRKLLRTVATPFILRK